MGDVKVKWWARPFIAVDGIVTDRYFHLVSGMLFGVLLFRWPGIFIGWSLGEALYREDCRVNAQDDSGEIETRL